ncbi:MAG: FG-GAP-like repeat-containing protein, partial [Dysgonamonadaceae bacterium]|nr:FG-GAP-like repeat-containing protein [Dysgonamonadaceae bacterium]
MKQKTFKNRSKFRNFLLFSFLLLLGGNLQAQPPLRAGFINSFVPPGQKDTINVIKKSELGSCNITGITVNLLSSAAALGTLQHGTAILSTDGNKNIIYTPAAGFVGQDSVKYTITCGVNVSNTGLILINVTDKPNVIKDEACAVTPPAMLWTIDSEYFFDPSIGLSNYQSVVVGDIDNDGIVEIIAVAKPLGSGTINGVVRPASSIAIFKGNNISAPSLVFDTEYLFAWGSNQKLGLVKTKINNKDTTLIIVPEGDNYLRAYNYKGQKVWQSDQVFHHTQIPYNSPSATFMMCVFADFNKDGIPEILLGNDLFDSATGNLLCSTTETDPENASIAADLFNTGTLNFVLANEIYDVSPSLNSLTLRKKITPPTITTADPDYTHVTPLIVPDGGRVSAVDMDHDGKLDLLISYVTPDDSCTVLYIADPVSGTVKASKYIPLAGSSSYPFVGDIDGDGNVEIVIIKSVSGSGTATDVRNVMYAFKYDGTPLLQTFWTLSHGDGSGATGMTLFDFDQDGKAEIVYRDMQHLRIIDGTADGAINYPDRNKAIFDNTSGTGTEYPVVADVNGDGQAEIIIIGASPLIAGTGSSLGALWIFRSGSADSPWAPARPVWNTPAYNPVYVNDDLSIPANPLNPASLFVDNDGNYLQPFNNFLQQSTLLNGEGKMLSYGSDLAFDLSVPIVYSNYTGATVDVTFNIVNTGDADFSGILDVSAYILQSGTFTKVQTYILNITIPSGTSIPISYTITGLPAGIDPANVMQIRINESDDNFLVPECNYSGNFSAALFGAPDYGLCPGNHTIYFYPLNTAYTYVWYNSDPTKTPKPSSIDTGDSHDFTKNATQLVEKFYVEVYDGPSLMDTYSVITYLIPDSLTWTGTTSSDWNDYRNWNYPTNPQPAITAYDTVKYQIPAECTNVRIPAGRTRYPNLGNFNVDIQANVACNKIYFSFGGEVARTDTLNYAEAYVDLTLNTHQYYMITPPLKSTYTGDYYITQPNPFLDDRLYEPMFFNVPNPQTLKTPVTTWTGRFNNPDILLNAGQGMAIWYNKLDQGYTYHNPVTTHFPKNDVQYHYYSEVPPYAPTTWSNYMDRTDSHRFIYEPLATTGLVPLSLGNQTVTAGGTPVLIGNPFMAHLNLDPFLTANSTEIYAGYKLASGVAAVDGKMNNFVSYQRVGETWFTTDPNLSGTVNNLTVAPTIAPMQSFIVIAKKANPQIKAPVTTMTTTPGNVLRSTAKNEIKVLSIVAQKEDELDKALLIGAGNSVFNAEEDSYKFFPNNNDKTLL